MEPKSSNHTHNNQQGLLSIDFRIMEASRKRRDKTIVEIRNKAKEKIVTHSSITEKKPPRSMQSPKCGLDVLVLLNNSNFKTLSSSYTITKSKNKRKKCAHIILCEYSTIFFTIIAMVVGAIISSLQVVSTTPTTTTTTHSEYSSRLHNHPHLQSNHRHQHHYSSSGLSTNRPQENSNDFDSIRQHSESIISHSPSMLRDRSFKNRKSHSVVLTPVLKHQIELLREPQVKYPNHRHIKDYHLIDNNQDDEISSQNKASVNRIKIHKRTKLKQHRGLNNKIGRYQSNIHEDDDDDDDDQTYTSSQQLLPPTVMPYNMKPSDEVDAFKSRNLWTLMSNDVAESRHKWSDNNDDLLIEDIDDDLLDTDFDDDADDDDTNDDDEDDYDDAGEGKNEDDDDVGDGDSDDENDDEAVYGGEEKLLEPKKEKLHHVRTSYDFYNNLANANDLNKNRRNHQANNQFSKASLHPTMIKTGHRLRNQHHHEVPEKNSNDLPSNKINYEHQTKHQKLPIVVSISDNSFVSASPISSDSDDVGLEVIEENETSPIDLESRQYKFVQPLASTTATTTTKSSNNLESLRANTPTNSIDFQMNRFDNDSLLLIYNNKSNEDDSGRQNRGRSIFNNFTNIDSNGEQQYQSPESVLTVRPESDKVYSNDYRARSGDFKSEEVNQFKAITTSYATDLKTSNNINSQDIYSVETNPSQFNSESDAPMIVLTSNANHDGSSTSYINDQKFEPVRHASLKEANGGQYSNIVQSPQLVVPNNGIRQRYWHNKGAGHPSHKASISIVQEDPNEFRDGGLNSALIAILFGIGATGMLIMIVGHKMRSIRERVAYRGRRRSLVPDTDFLINTIPI